MSPDYREFTRRRHRSLAAWLSLFQSRCRANALIISRKPLLEFLGITRMKDSRLDAFKEDVAPLFPLMKWYIDGATQTWKFRGTFSSVLLASDKKLPVNADLVFRNWRRLKDKGLNYVRILELPTDAEIADDLARSSIGLIPQHLETTAQQYLPKGLCAVEIVQYEWQEHPFVSCVVIRTGFDFTKNDDGSISLAKPKEPLGPNVGIPTWLEEKSPGEFFIRRLERSLSESAEPNEVYEKLRRWGFESSQDFCQAVANTRDCYIFHPSEIKLGPTQRQPKPEPETVEEPARQKS